MVESDGSLPTIVKAKRFSQHLLEQKEFFISVRYFSAFTRQLHFHLIKEIV